MALSNHLIGRDNHVCQIEVYGPQPWFTTDSYFFQCISSSIPNILELNPFFKMMYCRNPIPPHHSILPLGNSLHAPLWDGKMWSNSLLFGLNWRRIWFLESCSKLKKSNAVKSHYFEASKSSTFGHEYIERWSSKGVLNTQEIEKTFINLCQTYTE